MQDPKAPCPGKIIWLEVFKSSGLFETTTSTFNLLSSDTFIKDCWAEKMLPDPQSTIVTFFFHQLKKLNNTLG